MVKCLSQSQMTCQLANPLDQFLSLWITMICGQTRNGQYIITGIDLTTYHMLLRVNLGWGITDASIFLYLGIKGMVQNFPTFYCFILKTDDVNLQLE